MVLAGGIGLFNTKGTPTTSSSTTSTVAGTTTTINAKYGHLQALADQAAVRAGCPNDPYTRVNTMSWGVQPAMSLLHGVAYFAKVFTTAGDFTIRLNPSAPLTVNNFVFLAQHNFYHCVIFQRVIPGFVVQGGDPTGTGNGGPGYEFSDELPKTTPGKPTYPLYSVAMANLGIPNSNGSQFFIVVGKKGETLADKYSLFGEVVAGMNVVARIAREGQPSGQPLVINRVLNITITHG